MTSVGDVGPGDGCSLCPRLAAFREGLRAQWPSWHNNPVPAFGPLEARYLVVGLAPGARGANRTGRPFTGDYAGVLLYQTLIENGLLSGIYQERADDGIEALDVRITNAVRCVPPENKPTPAEQTTCRNFLVREVQAMPRLRAVLALGRVAHEAVLRVWGVALKEAPFAHGALHLLPGGVILGDSYHCSRYNQNTGRLTDASFRAVVQAWVSACRS